MKNIASSLFILFIFSNAYSQKIKIEWGDELETVKDDYIEKIIYADQDFIYAQVNYEKTVKFGIVSADMAPAITPGIIKLDKNLKFISRKDYTTNTKNLRLNGIFYFNNQFMLVTSKNQTREKSIDIYGASIDMKTLEMKNESSLIWALKSDKMNFKWNASTSVDSSLIVFTETFDQKDDENRKFAFKVVDKDLHVVQEKEVELPYTSESFTIINFSVSKNGDVYLIGKLYKDGAKKERVKNDANERVASYDVMIIKYGKEGTQKDYKIELGQKLLSSYVMKTDPTNDDLILLGTYQSIDANGLTGYFVTRVDSKAGTISYTKNNDFQLPFISRTNDLNDDKTKSKGPGISVHFKITDFEIQPDKSIYFVMEKAYAEGTDLGSGTAYTTYYAQSIIAAKIDSAGNQKWINLIPKNQYFNSLTAYLNHSIMIFNNKLFIFYNDIEKNLDYSLSSSDQPKRFNALDDMYLTMVEISDKGMMKKTSLLTPEQAGIPFKIKDCQQLNGNRFLIFGYSYKKKKFKFGLAKFE